MTINSSIRRICIAAAGAAGVVGVLAGASAAAEQPNISTAQMRVIAAVCKADIQRYCAGISPGGGRIAACMRQNASKLSPHCTAKLQEVISK